MIFGLLILIDPLILLFLLAPIPFWVAAPHRFEPVLIAFTVVCLVVAAVLGLRKLVRSFREETERPGAPRSDFRWRTEDAPLSYQHHLDLYLRTHGWHMLFQAVGERERVEIAAEKDRTRVALLCIPPGEKADEQDVKRLDAVGREWHTAQRAVVAHERPLLGSAGMLRLRYDELVRPDEVLGLDLA